MRRRSDEGRKCCLSAKSVVKASLHIIGLNRGDNDVAYGHTIPYTKLPILFFFVAQQVQPAAPIVSNSGSGEREG